MVLGLAVTQINTLCDSLLAWALAAPGDDGGNIAWLGLAVPYPMQRGAVAALYYGERLYQFPLGLLGMAVATVIFPALSRHAARDEHDRLADDLTLGLRLVLFLGVPAGAGLVLLSDPLARLLFEHGEFTADDAARVARMIACYGLGVWAFCALPVVVRGFYALGDQRTPVKAGLAAMVANLALNLALVWPMAEAGLALATSLSAILQLGVLVGLFVRQFGRLCWGELATTVRTTLIATAAMLAAGTGVLWLTPRGLNLGAELADVFLPIAAAGVSFAAVTWSLHAPELELLIGRRGRGPDEESDSSRGERHA
jgi:putative peptidoglycan lipid II flippase